MKKLLMIGLLLISSISFAGNERKPSSVEDYESEKAIAKVEKQLQASSSDYERLRRQQNYKKIYNSVQDYSEVVQSERRHP